MFVELPGWRALITGKTLDEYVYRNIYKPMGLRHIQYSPLQTYGKEQIPPTERDMRYLKQMLHGTVHDPNAALLGGVSGHAGLFSSAEDMGTLLQMVLQKGSYGGVSYFSPKTVATWTASQNGSHRGYGWDHQYNSGSPSMAASASLQTYGHLGFTGCAVWVDPQYELVYVFLSNRVYPEVNTRILGLNTRPEIHQRLYNAILKASTWDVF